MTQTKLEPLPIPKPKQIGLLTAPLRPSMKHRVFIARVRNEIKQEKTQCSAPSAAG